MPATPAPPPSVAALADRCVQCGLCLPACPTYGLERIEAESPRGRIALVRAWALEAATPTPVGDVHLDHCLGCRACEAVCPAQVEFGALLVGARARQRQRRGAGWRQRTLEALAGRPALLRGLLRAYRHVAPLLPASWRLLPRPPRAGTQAVARARSPRTRVALFAGCVARAYEAPARLALARICAALGVELVEPHGQGCCGSLHAHAGDTGGAAALAARNRAAFEATVPVLTLASGCHETVATAVDAPAFDALAWVAERADALAFSATPRRVGLHLPCTQRNVVGSARATAALLARIPGLQIVALDAGGCCGAAGTAMLLDAARAAAFRAPLLEQARAAGVEVIASANIGCRLHLGNAAGVPVVHPLELVATALRDDATARGFVDSRP